MKLKLLLVSILTGTLSLNAQVKEITGLASFKIINSGPLMDAKNDVDGYYFFFQADKLKDKQSEYAIRMLDNNLNEIATKSYIGDRGTVVSATKFNDQVLMYVLVNEKERYFKFLGFDKKGEVQIERKIEVERSEIKNRYAKNLLFPIDDKGFLFNYKKDNKGEGYKLVYQATDNGKNWEYASPKDVKMNFEATPLAANKNYIAVMEFAYKSNFSKNVDVNLMVFDINTGKLKYKKEFIKDIDPRFINNAYLDQDNQLFVLGEYYEKKDNIIRDESIGLYTQVFDENGNIVTDTKNNWENDIQPKMPAEIGTNGKNRGYIFFNDFIRSESGAYFAVGERYRKTVNALGIIGGYAATQLVITDAILVEFDENFKIKNIKAFEKGKSRLTSEIDFGSPQYNAYYMEKYGAFDYQYTQFDDRRNRFYSIFIDYERIKGEKNKYAYKAIIYNDGNITEDKIYLNSDMQTFIMPGKLGHVLIFEFDSKEKKLNARLAKLNI